MSNIRKCSSRTCKQSINIKRDSHLKCDGIMRHRPEYYCEHCGKELVKEFRNTGGHREIRDHFNYYVHIGQDLEWIRSIILDGLNYMNLDFKGGEVETEFFTINELIDRCNCDETTKVELREKARALNS